MRFLFELPSVHYQGLSHPSWDPQHPFLSPAVLPGLQAGPPWPSPGRCCTHQASLAAASVTLSPPSLHFTAAEALRTSARVLRSDSAAGLGPHWAAPGPAQAWPSSPSAPTQAAVSAGQISSQHPCSHSWPLSFAGVGRLTKCHPSPRGRSPRRPRPLPVLQTGLPQQGRPFEGLPGIWVGSKGGLRGPGQTKLFPQLF